MINDYENPKQQYSDEVRERWGDTEAYRESERRTAGYSQSDWNALYDGIDAIMAGFAELKADGASPDSERTHLHVECSGSLSPRICTPALTKSLRDSVRCMSPMNASQRTSTSTVKAPPRMSASVLKALLRSNNEP